MDLVGQTKNNSLEKLELRMTRSGSDQEALVPKEQASCRNAVVCGFRVKEGKMNRLDRGNRAPLPTVHRSHALFYRLATSRLILPSQGSAGRTTAWPWSEEPWCAHQRCLQRWIISPSASPESSFWYFLGRAEMSSLAITSFLVNNLSSMTLSCQELWSGEELTTTHLLDKRPGTTTAEPEPFHSSKCALLAWSQRKIHV